MDAANQVIEQKHELLIEANLLQNREKQIFTRFVRSEAKAKGVYLGKTVGVLNKLANF